MDFGSPARSHQNHSTLTASDPPRRATRDRIRPSPGKYPAGARQTGRHEHQPRSILWSIQAGQSDYAGVAPASGCLHHQRWVPIGPRMAPSRSRSSSSSISHHRSHRQQSTIILTGSSSSSHHRTNRIIITNTDLGSSSDLYIRQARSGAARPPAPPALDLSSLSLVQQTTTPYGRGVTPGYRQSSPAAFAPTAPPQPIALPLPTDRPPPPCGPSYTQADPGLC